MVDTVEMYVQKRKYTTFDVGQPILAAAAAFHLSGGLFACKTRGQTERLPRFPSTAETFRCPRVPPSSQGITHVLTPSGDPSA